MKINDHKSNFFNYLINTSRVYWREEIETLTEDKQQEYIKNNRFSITSNRLTEEQNQEQIHHLVNKIFAIGYLLHRYKDKSRAWCVFATDNKISDLGESNGRSGKSITFESLFHILKYDVIGGRNKDVFQNKHVFENITEHTDYLLIDDAHQYLDFDFLFDKITGVMPINPKFNAGYKLPFELSPKTAITSNHSLRKLDGSTYDRILFAVYSDWYHVANDNNDYLENEDWNNDLNFFAQVISFFLSRKSPEKINPPMDNVNKRNSLAVIGQNFNDWAESYFVDERLTLRIPKDDAFRDFQNTCNIRNMTSNKFTRNLKEWCKIKDFELNPKELGDRVQMNHEGKTVDAIYIQPKQEQCKIF